QVYCHSLTWSHNLQHTMFDDAAQGLVPLVARFNEGIVEGIEQFAEKLKSCVEDLNQRPPYDGERRQYNLSVSMGFPEGLSDEFERELAKILSSIAENPSLILG